MIIENNIVHKYTLREAYQILKELPYSFEEMEFIFEEVIKADKQFVPLRLKYENWWNLPREDMTKVINAWSKLAKHLPPYENKSVEYKCPYCSKKLNSLGRFDSIPCHFSYSEDVSDFLTGEQFECVQEDLNHDANFFYIDDEHPGELMEGNVLGG